MKTLAEIESAIERTHSAFKNAENEDDRARWAGNLRALVEHYDMRKAAPGPKAVQKPMASPARVFAQGMFQGWLDDLQGLGANIGSRYFAAKNPEQAARLRSQLGAGSVGDRAGQLQQIEAQNARSLVKEYERENPKTAMGLQLGGSMIPGIGLLGRATTGLRMLGLGAAEGALAGAGEADENRLAGAGFGGIGGGLMAGAIPAAGHLAREGSGIVKDWATPILNRLMQQPETRAGQILGERLQAGGITPTILQSRARQLGPQATVAEAAGEAGQNLGQGVVGVDATGAARLTAARNYGSRMGGMSQRVRDAAASATGVSERLQASLDAVRARQVAASAPLYKEAYSQVMPMTHRLRNLLKRPPMEKAFDAAKKSALTRGEQLPPWFKMDEFGQWVRSGVMPDMRAWDRMKQGLDVLIKKQRNIITGRLSPQGVDLVILQKQLLGELDDLNKPYAKARAAFAGDAAIEESMRSGEKFLTMKTRDVHQTIKSMTSDSEREAFMTGAVEAMREKIGRGRSGEMKNFKFLTEDNAMEKLRAMFPAGKEGTRALAQLNRSLRGERVLRETDASVLRGSTTALRQQEAARLDSQASMPTGADIMGSPVKAGAQAVVGTMAKSLGKEKQATIDKLAELLFTSGNVSQAIAELEKVGVPPAMIQQYVNRFSLGSAALAPAVGYGIGGSMQ